MPDDNTPLSASRTFGPRWFWVMIWGGFWLVILLLTLLYSRLPSDGYTGDLESFAVKDGFLVRFNNEPRDDGLLPGDIVRRIDGHTIDEWLEGIPSISAHWYRGGLARYDLERNGQPTSLNILLKPNNLFSWMTWPPRLVVMLAFSLIGSFVFFKRPDDGDARRLMLFCMAVTVCFYSDVYNFQLSAVILRYPLWIQLAIEHVFYGLQFVLAAHFAMSFPSPYSLWAKFPRLAPVILWLVYFVPVMVATLAAPTVRDALVEGNRAAIFGSLVSLLIVLFAYGRNLQRIKDPVQRSQSKWIMWSAMLAGTLTFPIYFLPLIVNTGRLIPPDFTYFLLSLIPLSFAVAILRFRLFSIDLVINRSLVYGTAFIVLVTLLLGTFTLISRMVDINSPVWIGVLILASVLLTRPVVGLMQWLVDRYVYNFRFDLNDLIRAHHQRDIKRPGLYTGRTIEGYKLGDVLGRGSMSEVYAGYKDKRVVTVKILLPELVDDEKLFGHFKHEAEAMAGLSHPNIRTLYHQGEIEGMQYLILEHIEGYDLKTHLREHGPLSLDEARNMMSQLASALDYLHSCGIVHRDLKPENIMLQQEPDSKHYHVWLTDFGLAKLSTQVVSIYGEEAVGTINYMSPEQIQTKKTIDHRADIYAMGVVLYEMLTGTLPFKGSLAQILFAHLNQPVPDICDVLPEMPGDVSWAIMSAMAKEAAERPNTAREFVAMVSGSFVEIPMLELVEAV